MKTYSIRVQRFAGSIAVVALLLVATCAAMAQNPQAVVVQGVGLQTPESVLHDPGSDVYLVSSINGHPTAADGNGFISRIDPNGKVVALKWIAGGAKGVRLNAPKGMAIGRGTLYVADIRVVRLFNLRTREPKGPIAIPGATFLNDVAPGSDGIYVTDRGLKADFTPSGTDAVYRIDWRGRVTTITKSRALNRPNGVRVLPDGRLVVVTSSKPGEVYVLDQVNGQRLFTLKLSAGQLDGVMILPGNGLEWLVSSWGASAVYRIKSGSPPKVVVSNVKSPADIGYDAKRKRVLIPSFQENRLIFHPLIGQ